MNFKEIFVGNFIKFKSYLLIHIFIILPRIIIDIWYFAVLIKYYFHASNLLNITSLFPLVLRMMILCIFVKNLKFKQEINAKKISIVNIVNCNY